MAKQEIVVNRKKIKELSRIAVDSAKINDSAYAENGLHKWLRDINGIGVSVGLTRVAEPVATKKNKDGEIVPCAGSLYYRGISVESIVKGFVKEKRFGFEEVVYLLLFGKLPTEENLKSFTELMASYRTLSDNVVNGCLTASEGADIMTTMQKGVLDLYAEDSDPESLDIEHIIAQSLSVIAKLPVIGSVAYNAKRLHGEESVILRKPDTKGLSTAENILKMIRPSGEYTPLEAKILDVCLVLQADNGGGDNSAFLEHIVSSSGTDTYSALSSALASVKGFRHGGAAAKVPGMMEDIYKNARSHSDEDLKAYLADIIDGKAYDKTGKIYGVGHAVYSVSDPRVKILRSIIKPLAVEKDMEELYNFYRKIEKLAPETISEKRKIYKGVSANVDFYTSFIYNMLGIPVEFYTAIFATARIAGICAHRIEEMVNGGKMIRPKYTSVSPITDYVKKSDRK